MIVAYGDGIMLAGVVFLLGLFCIVAHRNLIMTLIGVEVMMNAATIAFVISALRWRHMDGQIFVLFIIGVAAAEVSVGLILIVRAYRRTGSLDPDGYNILKW